MTINTYIEQYQKPLFKTFTNELKNDTLAHAYLISGPQGTPLKEIALTLAKTLFCTNPNPLACNNCLSCHRFNEGVNQDFLFLDGSEGNIKIDAIRSLSTEFSKTAIGASGLLVYVIHLAEKMTPEAANSLLKFLEEPTLKTIAFLTTENEDNLLPTIISRSQKLPVSLVPHEIILQNCDELGIPRIYSELLVEFYNYPETIKEVYQTEEFNEIYTLFTETINAFSTSLENAILYLQKDGIKIIQKGNQRYRMGLFIRLFVLLLRDLINYNVQTPLNLTSYEDKIARVSRVVKNPEKLLTIFLESYNRINSNVNIPLLMDHLLYEIYKESK
jgi:DNA polymerase-3 subunit delta'